jgi:phage head maturation protease
MPPELRATPMDLDFDGDGDDDSTPEGDTDHDFWTVDGNPINSAWMAVGKVPPGGFLDGDPNVAEVVNYASKTKRAHTAATTSDQSAATRCPGCQTMQTADSGSDVCDVCGTELTDEYVTGNGTVGIESGVGSATAQGFNSKAPRTNLVRAMPQGFEVRATDGTSSPNDFFMTFSKFNQWYEVSSAWEGDFMERVLPGSFTDTIRDDGKAFRVLYDHGMDPSIGNKPLGPVRTYEERVDGPYVDGPFLDTSYNKDELIPMLTGRLLDGSTVGSQLGASFRFEVLDDHWSMQPKVTSWNPKGLPQRSIKKTRTFEAGPVTFPASPGAEAAARSLSDEWLARLIGDTRFQSDFAARVGEKVAERIIRSVPREMQQEILHQRRQASGHLDAMRRRAKGYLAIA